MTHTKEITIWCDNTMCDTWYQICESKLSTANRIAKKEGWKSRDGMHLCPDCAKGYKLWKGEVVDK